MCIRDRISSQSARLSTSGWGLASPHPEVDNLADWLLISQLQLGGQPPESPLAEITEEGVTLRISKAAGEKCARCWHYEPDIGSNAEHPEICGRCVAAIGA